MLQIIHLFIFIFIINHHFLANITYHHLNNTLNISPFALSSFFLEIYPRGLNFWTIASPPPESAPDLFETIDNARVARRREIIVGSLFSKVLPPSTLCQLISCSWRPLIVEYIGRAISIERVLWPLFVDEQRKENTI